jgi:hypothetical protein
MIVRWHCRRLRQHLDTDAFKPPFDHAFGGG